MEKKYIPMGDSSLLIQFDDVICKEVNRQVNLFSKLIEKSNIYGIREIIPSYNAIQIVYDPLNISLNDLVSIVSALEDRLINEEEEQYKLIKIPVLYGGSCGQDLEFVAKHNGISVEEVIDIHCREKYLIYMMGFTPGFAYLGGLNPKIATPRLETPRQKINAGSVGIADSQTGIYPIDSPGGWQIIGRTPLKLYVPEKKPPFLLEHGIYIQFQPIDIEEYQRIEQLIMKNEYNPEITYFQD